MLSRLRSAARILLKGDPRKNKRNPIPAITLEEVAEIKQFFSREKFFIFGHARSGTTLLTRLARLHPEVHCNYQAHFFTRQPLLKSLVNTPEAEEWLTRKSNRWNQGGDLSALVLRASADFILERDAAREGKNIVGDKSPSSTIHGQAVRDMHAVYPDAKLVYIVRDGRDVLISERFRNFVEESKFLTAEDQRIIADLKVDPAPFTDGRRSIFTEAFIRRVAKGWVANLKETEDEGRRLFGDHYFGMRYEDLLQTPFNEMSKLWNFLGVKSVDAALGEKIKAEMSSNPDEEWQAKRNEGIASFLPKGHAGNWSRLFTEKDKAVFKEVAGEMLIKWNYEKDLNW
ncbi:sulfotransferase [Candidatus Villigracilis saccharophilus]|uniref:sulfotransferase family protein n=1 Tax=Candidatus Villigracilis saccharophilus TaxID=3140684 RepID=UPI003137494F|nr:sulfotransferase [Anaerolineales bacterium]